MNLLGVDRLDYTKGLTNRLLAFERLLEEHPELIENCILLQVFAFPKLAHLVIKCWLL